ncbi:MAG: leucine-rich repeat domain-containing protein [Promethearchaeota archaeon]|nr:MAG: leucine-rich repeat domain-containing protein [Candidatus Lokiarchaeota archaeon]
MLNIPVNRVEDYDEIESIDEAVEILDRSMERNPAIRGKVSPEEEFLGHCSNLQAWEDNGYDTRILHRNLAFPLLKKLTDVGDPIAKRKFKEEIAIRYASGHPTVMRFLIQNGYLKYLSDEEFETILDDIKSPLFDEISGQIEKNLKHSLNQDAIKNINLQITKLFRFFRFNRNYMFLFQIVKRISRGYRQRFVEIVLNRFRNTYRFPMVQFMEYLLNNFEDIKIEYVKYNGRIIGFLNNEILILKKKNIRDIDSIEGIRDFSDKIIELDLSYNNISEIKGLENLKNLRKLNLRNNLITQIKGIDLLKKLEYIDLSGNINISEIPDILNDLPDLKTIKLSGCRINKFSDAVSKFFWMGDNYRCYTKYIIEDIEYYEKHHKGKAKSNNKLYKNFVKWLFKLSSLRKEYKFSYRDIKSFESETDLKAIWSGKLSVAFKKWLIDKKQKKITSFI